MYKHCFLLNLFIFFSVFCFVFFSLLNIPFPISSGNRYWSAYIIQYKLITASYTPGWKVYTWPKINQSNPFLVFFMAVLDKKEVCFFSDHGVVRYNPGCRGWPMFSNLLRESHPNLEDNEAETEYERGSISQLRKKEQYFIPVYDIPLPFPSHEPKSPLFIKLLWVSLLYMQLKESWPWRTGTRSGVLYDTELKMWTWSSGMESSNKPFFLVSLSSWKWISLSNHLLLYFRV